MNMLSPEETARLTDLARQIEEVGEETQAATRVHNDTQATTWAAVEELQGRFNELLGEANDFVQGIHEEQEDFQGRQPETWHATADGQTYAEWAEEWSLWLEPIGITECPEPIDDLEMEEADILRELSVMPE